MVELTRENYTERNTCSAITVSPIAGTNLVTQEFTYDGKIEKIVLTADEAAWFMLIRKTSAGVESNEIPFYLNEAGELILDETFADPIIEVSAGDTWYIRIPNAAIAGKKYAASMKSWERLGP